MAYLGATPPDELLAAWGAVRDARDRALSFLRERAADGVAVRGCEVDDVARRVIDDRGYGPRFVHRLGHSIDRRLHGAGPNLDNLETRDERRLIPGVGFSVEPGVYLTGRFGVRSEVNVHWGDDGPEVTPDEIQRDLLLFPGEPER
jgi:Xaa-Pro aminopeptidase